MRRASERVADSAEKTVRDIRRATRRRHSAEDKIRIVLEGLRGEVSVAELCRKEGINQNLYYRWSKEPCAACSGLSCIDHQATYLATVDCETANPSLSSSP